jgi:hypothetical protein
MLYQMTDSRPFAALIWKLSFQLPGPGTDGLFPGGPMLVPIGATIR